MLQKFKSFLEGILTEVITKYFVQVTKYLAEL